MISKGTQALNMGATLHLVQSDHPPKPAINSLAGSKRQNNTSNCAGAVRALECSVTSILRKTSGPAAVCKRTADTSSPPFSKDETGPDGDTKPSVGGLGALVGCKPACAWPQDDLKPCAKVC